MESGRSEHQQEVVLMTDEERRAWEAQERKKYLVNQIAALRSVARAVLIQRERLVRMFPAELKEDTAIMGGIDTLAECALAVEAQEDTVSEKIAAEFPEQGVKP